MKWVIVAMLSGVLILISQALQGLTSQGHYHWLSDLVHFLALLLVGGMIVGSFVYKQLLRRVRSLKRVEKNHDAQCHSSFR